MPEAGMLLQTVALSLPAVALYMSVLTDLHRDVTRIDSLSPDPDSPAFDGPGPASGRIDHNRHRDYVTLTIAMDGTDFRLAAISLFVLLASAIALVVSTVVPYATVYLVGAGLTVSGFVILLLALACTVYASAKQLYPGW